MIPPVAVLVAIVALGAGLRFLNLGLVHHSYDDSYPAYDALRMFVTHRLLLVGQPSSVFLDNPALMSYLQAIPLLVWRSPWAVYIFVVVLNTTAIWFVYCAARELLGETVGLLAAFLFAVNPWVVYFSRTTWVQALIPFLTAFIAWGWWPGMATDRCRPSRVLAAGLATVAMTQTYIQAWGVLAQAAPLVVLFWRRLPRRALCISLLALILAVAAYALGLAQDWDASRAKLVGFATGEPALTWDGLNHAVRLVSGRDFEYVYARSETAEYERRRALSLVAHSLLAVALVAGAVLAVEALRRPGQARRTGAILLIWFAVPVLLMSVRAQRVHPHYLLLTCPAGHVLAAWGIAPLLRRPWLRRVVVCVLLLIALLFALNLQRANTLVATQPMGPLPGEGALIGTSRVGDAVRDLTRDCSRPARIVAQGQDALYSSLSGTYVTVLLGLDFPHFVVLPGDEPLLYVLINTPATGEALGPLHQSWPSHEVRLGGGTRISFLRAMPYSREAAMGLPQVALGWPSEAGLSMLGYSIEGDIRPGRPLSCTTFWRVDQLYGERMEWYVGAFYHLLDRSKRIVANVSGHAQWGYRWQLGDVYVERASIKLSPDLAPGEYRLEIGLFDSIHGSNYHLHGPAGKLYALTIPITVGEEDGS